MVQKIAESLSKICKTLRVSKGEDDSATHITEGHTPDTVTLVEGILERGIVCKPSTSLTA